MVTVVTATKKFYSIGPKVHSSRLQLCQMRPMTLLFFLLFYLRRSKRYFFASRTAAEYFLDPVSLCLEIAAVQVNDMKLWDCWTTSCDFMGRVHQPLPFAGLRRHWKKIFLINIIMPRVVHTYMCVPIPTCVYPYLHVCTHTYMYVTILTCM